MEMILTVVVLTAGWLAAEIRRAAEQRRADAAMREASLDRERAARVMAAADALRSHLRVMSPEIAACRMSGRETLAGLSLQLDDALDGAQRR